MGEVAVRGVDRATRERFCGRAADMMETLTQPDQTTELAFWRGDTVLALWRGTVQWPGVAVVAGSVSDSARGENAVTLVRLTARMLLGWAYEHRLRRISAYVLASQEEYLRFAELVGFVEEARLSGAAPDGGDLILMTRYFEWIQSSAVTTRRQSCRRRSLKSTSGRSGRATRDG